MPIMSRSPPYRTVPISYLHEVLTCDPAMGQLTWKQRPRSHFTNQWTYQRWNEKYPGKRAGLRTTGGYMVVDVGPYEGKPMQLLVSRVVWAITTEEWPVMSIDHINQIRDDDRFVNLREATVATQLRNRTLSDRKNLPRGSYRKRTPSC
jgi:hypothetical protein